MAHAATPYLRSLSASPVQWNEWGETAWQVSRESGKPIFLSIGSPICAWCRRMDRETLQSSPIVESLNQNFVCIKVDREARPDVSQVYLTYVQAVTGRAGWPLHVWLTPELHPFYGGTYFTSEDKADRVGLATVLRSIVAGWKSDPASVIAEGRQVIANLHSHQDSSPLGRAIPDLTDPASDAFEQAYTYLFENYDAQSGGFGGAPKFPRWVNLGFLMRCAVIQGVDSELGREALGMVLHTLRQIMKGGIHDQVGGGVFRYALDDDWKLPHFEKRLTDQAQLVSSLVECTQFTDDPRFGVLAEVTLMAVLNRFTASVGSVFATAERVGLSSSGRGNPSLWTRADVTKLLGSQAAEFCAFFGVEEEGNLPLSPNPDEAQAGQNVLYQATSLSEFAAAQGVSEADVAARLSAGLATLREVRRGEDERPCGDVILASANGLMIGALARAAMALSPSAGSPRDDAIVAAIRAAEFVEREMWDQASACLSHAFALGRSSGLGFAEDYAAMIHGLLELYDATLSVRWLHWAHDLQKEMDRQFWDPIAGGYFQSSTEDRSVILRLKESHDGAEPSANSLAALNGLRLGALLDDEGNRRRGIQILQAFRGSWAKTPWNHAYLLMALEWAVTEPKRVILFGQPEDATWRALRAELRGRQRGPFVTLGWSAGHREGEGAGLGALPPIDWETGDAAVARVYRQETLLGEAQSAAALRQLLAE